MNRRSISQAAAILLAALVFCTSFAMPFAKAEVDFPARTVDLLILYDQSYKAYWAGQGITDPVHRLEQMAELAVVPFQAKLNITLNITIQSYQSVLGPSYAMACPIVYPEDNFSIGNRVSHHWEYDEQCDCDGLDDAYSNSRHHNNLSTLLDAIDNYCSNQTTYDAVGVYFAFNGCHSCHIPDAFHHPPGIARRLGKVFAATGTGDPTNMPYQHLNLTSCVALLWHEFSHTFGLSDGSNDFVTNPSDNCTENYPCTMSGGFDHVIYAPNVWCPNCLYKLSENGGGMAGHYD